MKKNLDSKSHRRKPGSTHGVKSSKSGVRTPGTPKNTYKSKKHRPRSNCSPQKSRKTSQERYSEDSEIISKPTKSFPSNRKKHETITDESIINLKRHTSGNRKRNSQTPKGKSGHKAGIGDRSMTRKKGMNRTNKGASKQSNSKTKFKTNSKSTPSPQKLREWNGPAVLWDTPCVQEIPFQVAFPSSTLPPKPLPPLRVPLLQNPPTSSRPSHRRERYSSSSDLDPSHHRSRAFPEKRKFAHRSREERDQAHRVRLSLPSAAVASSDTKYLADVKPGRHSTGMSCESKPKLDPVDKRWDILSRKRTYSHEENTRYRSKEALDSHRSPSNTAAINSSPSASSSVSNNSSLPLGSDANTYTHHRGSGSGTGSSSPTPKRPKRCRSESTSERVPKIVKKAEINKRGLLGDKPSEITPIKAQNMPVHVRFGGDTPPSTSPEPEVTPNVKDSQRVVETGASENTEVKVKPEPDWIFEEIVKIESLDSKTSLKDDKKSDIQCNTKIRMISSKCKKEEGATAFKKDELETDTADKGSEEKIKTPTWKVRFTYTVHHTVVPPVASVGIDISGATNLTYAHVLPMKGYDILPNYKKQKGAVRTALRVETITFLLRSLVDQHGKTIKKLSGNNRPKLVLCHSDKSLHDFLQDLHRLGRFDMAMRVNLEETLKSVWKQFKTVWEYSVKKKQFVNAKSIERKCYDLWLEEERKFEKSAELQKRAHKIGKEKPKSLKRKINAGSEPEVVTGQDSLVEDFEPEGVPQVSSTPLKQGDLQHSQKGSGDRSLLDMLIAPTPTPSPEPLPVETECKPIPVLGEGAASDYASQVTVDNLATPTDSCGHVAPIEPLEQSEPDREVDPVAEPSKRVDEVDEEACTKLLETLANPLYVYLGNFDEEIETNAEEKVFGIGFSFGPNHPFNFAKQVSYNEAKHGTEVKRIGFSTLKLLHHLKRKGLRDWTVQVCCKQFSKSGRQFKLDLDGEKSPKIRKLLGKLSITLHYFPISPTNPGVLDAIRMAKEITVHGEVAAYPEPAYDKNSNLLPAKNSIVNVHGMTLEVKQELVEEDHNYSQQTLVKSTAEPNSTELSQEEGWKIKQELINGGYI